MRRSQRDRKPPDAFIPSFMATKVDASEIPVLGLQRVDEYSNNVANDANANGNANANPIITVQPQQTLGRNRKNNSLAMPNHVDLGLTYENAAHVSKLACTVESVSATELVLRIRPRILKGDFFNPRVLRLNTEEDEEVRNYCLVLHPGDVFIFVTGPEYPDHSFRVVPTTITRQQQQQKKALKALNNTTASSSGPNSNAKRLSVDQTVMESPVRPTKKSSRSFLAPGEVPYVFPWDISLEDQTKNLLFPLPSSVAAVLPEPQDKQEWRATTLKPSTTESSPESDASDDDDDDDDDELHGNVPPMFQVQDMHVSLANAYSRALLNSNTPAVGSTLLHTLLMGHQRLPTLKLCGELVQFITFGAGAEKQGDTSATAVARRKGPKTTDSGPYWDPNRLQLAYQYVEDVLERHPDMAYDRFGEAAGSDYWRNVLEQLYTLPYYDCLQGQESDSSNSTSSRMLEDSLQLHIMALKLLYRLVNGMIHRPCMASPIIRDMDEYGGRGVCRLAATVAAHVWVEHYDRVSGTTMLSLVWDLTHLLGSIQTLLLEKFVLSRDDDGSSRSKVKMQKMNDAVELLWSAMDRKIKDSDRHKDKEWVQSLKQMWVDSFDRDDLEKALAKRLGLVTDFTFPH